jgi:hypothetical protein
MVCLAIISVLVLRGVPGEIPEMLSGLIANWQVVHPEEDLLFGVVSSVCPGIQGDCKVTAKRMA